MLYCTAVIGLYSPVLLVSGNGFKVLHRSAPATMPGSSNSYPFTAGEKDIEKDGMSAQGTQCAIPNLFPT